MTHVFDSVSADIPQALPLLGVVPARPTAAAAGGGGQEGGGPTEGHRTGDEAYEGLQGGDQGGEEQAVDSGGEGSEGRGVQGVKGGKSRM